MRGSVKKIDELGRIVIPRDIRKSLSIKANDSLEVGIVDNAIRIEKNKAIKNYDDKALYYAKLFSDCDVKILVTNRDKILFNNTDVVDFDVSKYINLSLYELIEKKSIWFNSDMRPIIIDSNVEGLVLVIKSSCNELVGELFNKLLTTDLDITC